MTNRSRMMHLQSGRVEKEEVREGIAKACASCEKIFRDLSIDGDQLTCHDNCKPVLKGRYYVLIGLGALFSLVYFVV